MKKNFFEKNSRIILAAVNLLFVGLVALVLQWDIFQDSPNGEKYNLIDKVAYDIRCPFGRQIKLRENKVNLKDFRIPPYAPAEKYEFRTDSNGFIEPSAIHQNPDAKIFFLGGSTTECEMVEELQRFPYLAGRILEEKTGKKINAYNAARSGNDLIHAYNIFVNKIIPLRPDMVVYMDNINNLSTLLYEASYWNNNKTRSNLLCFSKKKSSLRNGNNEWDESPFVNMIGNKAHQQNIKNEHRKVLKLFIASVKAVGAAPILMTQPNRIENNPNFSTGHGDAEFNKTYRQLYIEFNEITRQIAREEHVALIDLAKDVQWNEKLIYDAVHLTNDGSKLVAQIVAESLGKKL